MTDIHTMHALAQLVPEGSRVLDLGCGDGAMLAHLQRTRGCTGYGVELDDANVLACVQRGVNVIQLNLDAGLWIGTPLATTWRKQIWGQRSVAEAPSVGPGQIYLPRWIGDWRDLPAEERGKVRFLLLQNGDDPIPKFWFEVLWRRPAWLGPQGSRPPGAPRRTVWWPVTTFFATFIDMLNALAPTPGV